ncbi:MAG: hypothetical protein CMP59_12775 [Flavobacteriales bacterium]|nr:hypothetical protein [Flavobacteriales bacterium]|tara:strand:+ start:59 stop:919 length:861 start_codon:yes stop_codon:yes gene_type:complete
MQFSPKIFFREILHFIVYGNLFVAFGSYALSVFFLAAIEIDHAYLHSFPLFVFTATLFTYNFHRRIGIELYNEEINSTSTKWMIDHPVLSRATTLLSFAAAVYFFMDLPKNTYILIAPLSLISLMYVIKLSDKAPLRQIPFLKIFLIALAWSMATILLGALSYDQFIDKQIILFSMALFFYMIAEVIPFDIRDMRSDESTDLLTIPNFWGIKFSLWIAIICLLLSNLLFLLAVDFKLNIFSISWILSSIFLFIFILLSKKPKADLYYSLLIESSLSLPFLFSFLMA